RSRGTPRHCVRRARSGAWGPSSSSSYRSPCSAPPPALERPERGHQRENDDRGEVDQGPRVDDALGHVLELSEEADVLDEIRAEAAEELAEEERDPEQDEHREERDEERDELVVGPARGHHADRQHRGGREEEADVTA